MVPFKASCKTPVISYHCHQLDRPSSLFMTPPKSLSEEMSYCITPCPLFLPLDLVTEGEKGTRCKKSCLLSFKTGEQRAVALPLSQIYSCTQAPLSYVPSTNETLLHPEMKCWANKLQVKVSHSFPCHAPICTFLSSIPAAFSHALWGEQGGYAGCQHSECSSADVSCLWQAEGKGVVWGTVWKSG